MADALIRRAFTPDADDLTRIEEAADALLVELLAPPSWPEVEPGDVRLALPGFALIAEIDGEPVGFAHVMEIDDHAHLEQLSVLPAHAGAGIGRALLTAAIDDARARGHALMTLRTFAEVPFNAPFYASAGFVVAEPDTDFLRELIDIETSLGLTDIGPRVQMSLAL
ncbi:GNAT family N-acetyltransferase [Microbacterium sp. ZW T5_56]|uniref:GNAT family N-acetyltransferase n=1 Tax=Microbacterium sp. ZW T5_56 TaxID=3378081 RepID=UPI003851A9C8